MDFYMPRSAGIAEVYRAFAYFLGWPSSNYANKVMALSALARGELFKEKYIFFVDKQNNMQSDIENNPSTPESTLYMVSSLLRKHGFKGIVPRKPNDSFRECHIDLAAWVQDETERAIFSKVNSLIRQTGITNICISGGVAYNCLAIGKMLGNTIAKNVFIHPASGDHGQCLGNAIYGHIHVFGKWKNRQRFTPYLGGEEALTINKIGCAIKAYPFLRAIEDENIANEVAKLLAQGKIVAWFQGRSEYGPRALGNRSILANPSIQILGERLNITKGRESFMPFAPSVIAEKTGEFFELPFDSPYMAAAFRTRMGKAKEIPSVVHVDGSSRIQQVEKGDNFLFYNLIDEFRKLTSIPLVLNTSFNGSGEPIVENFDDALKTFINLDIDYLAAGPFLIEKEKRYKESLMIRAEDDAALIFDLNSGSIADLKISLHKQFPFARLVPRKRFLLYSKYLDWLREGRKATTIRFNRNGIELPSGPVVPLFSTDSVKPGAKEVAAGQVRINRVVVKHFGKLSKCDALNDGFNDLDELTRVMQEIYGNISADDCVSVYSIQLIRP
jgi:predicted NodU family carbamoyl transferase